MVAPVTTAAFLPLVAPHVVGAPVSIMERQIRNAAIEFCERTRCWRHIASVDMDSRDGVIVAPDWAAIHEFENAAWNDMPLTPLAYSSVALRPDDPSDNSQPSYISQINPNAVSVYPFSTGALTVSVWLKPRGDTDFSRAETGPMEDYYNRVPDFLLSQHGEAIGWGALARIMALPGQPFTDGKLALFYLQRFNTYVDGKFSQNMRGQHRAPRRTKIRFF